jgi:hypothetical protein
MSQPSCPLLSRSTRQLKQDKQGMRPSVERVEITALPLQIINLLKLVLTGTKMIPEAFDAIVKEVRIRKRDSGLEVLKDYEKG